MFVGKMWVRGVIQDKDVVILGSAPNVVDTPISRVKGLLVVLNNYKLWDKGLKPNVYYSYFGKNVKKTVDDIQDDKIGLIMCKYPNASFISHNEGMEEIGKSEDFRWVYEYRSRFFGELGRPVYVPDINDFNNNYKRLNRIPTTGMSAILDILNFNPRSLFISGFDFFKSKMHNINESWNESTDGGGHDFEGERELMHEIAKRDNKITLGEVE